MTTISEHGFSAVLPGQWIADPEPEPGGMVWRQFGGEDVLTVMLLGVNPGPGAEDRRQLLVDYINHRALVEEQRMEGLVQFEEEISEHDDGRLEALWSGASEDETYQQRHRTILYDDVLLDVCIGGSTQDPRVFDMGAVMILSSASFRHEDADEAGAEDGAQDSAQDAAEDA